MAETLGSLIDKLSIKNLREYHIEEMMRQKKIKFSKKELASKIKILKNQKKQLNSEIEEYILTAVQTKNVIKDFKLKLYNKKKEIGKTGNVTTLSGAIEELSLRNIRLWHLEDEARREDVPLSYIGSVKRKIDIVNQQRNDFIDLIDRLFEKTILKTRKK